MKGVGIAPFSTSTTEGITPATQPGTEGQAGGQTTGEQATGGQTTGGSIGKMTDEIYIEILAQTAYYVQKYAQDPKSFVSHVNVFYEKYGVTKENFQAYGVELEKNPQHLGEIAARYAQRLMELQATGK